MKGAHRVEIGKHERWAEGRATWEEDGSQEAPMGLRFV